MAYDVAFALVWVDGDDRASTRNEAYAFASCADCAAVAVGFQVVLIVGTADVVVPENLAAAVNYNCVQCLTYALASQLVVTLDGPLSDAGMAALKALGRDRRLRTRHHQPQPVRAPGRARGLQDQILDVIDNDPSRAPDDDPTTTEPSESPSESPSAEPSDAPSGAPSEAPSESPGTQPSESPPASSVPSGTTEPSTSPSLEPSTSAEEMTTASP